MPQEVIKRLSAVLPLSWEEQEKIAPFLVEENLTKGDKYLAQGQICKKVGFVTEGLLKSVHTKDNGDQYIPNFIQQGELAIHLDSFTQQIPTQEYIEAIQPTQVFSLSLSNYKVLEADIPHFSKILFLIMERKFIALDRLKSQLLSESAENRVSILLKEQPKVVQQASKKDIASFLGLSKYTMSRIKMKS